MTQIEIILDTLGIVLPEDITPKGNYALVKEAGNLYYLSGCGPFLRGEMQYLGKVGADLTIEEAYQAARLTAINIMGIIKSRVAPLSEVRIIKMLAFVASAADFYDQAAVVDGATDLLFQIMGEDALPARSAVAVPQLPFNSSIEIEVIVQKMNAI